MTHNQAAESDGAESGQSCNWPQCNSAKTGKCFAWCKCRCHNRRVAKNGGTTVTEWGIVVDDLGSADMADSEGEARDWLANGQGLSLIRVVVTEWPRTSSASTPEEGQS